jgi:lipopolysaccharide/colanic/teichoic acid biosynthesis glycosyltransferase
MHVLSRFLYLVLKTIADRLLACLLLLLSLPAVVVIIIAIKWQNSSPVFFKQQRVGYKARLFWVYKFCTMSEGRDAQGELLPDASRLTRLGRFLRKTSLDELPQLWNILRGDMSFVGPRPLLPEYLPLYNVQQASRHSVKQGLTGWAQIKGRNALDWQTRLELDAQYAEKASFLLDVYIIVQTFWLLFVKRDGDILAEKFKGN